MGFFRVRSDGPHQGRAAASAARARCGRCSLLGPGRGRAARPAPLLAARRAGHRRRAADALRLACRLDGRARRRRRRAARGSAPLDRARAQHRTLPHPTDQRHSPGRQGVGARDGGRQVLRQLEERPAGVQPGAAPGAALPARGRAGRGGVRRADQAGGAARAPLRVGSHFLCAAAAPQVAGAPLRCARNLRELRFAGEALAPTRGGRVARAAGWDRAPRQRWAHACRGSGHRGGGRRGRRALPVV
mmetsp:Transcript_42088/g.103779  ORF Transcript_42088/g.103779 Transcript_42088/m.103779 type:complete len:246 (-) Transcript_42088:943-1680(-)